MLITGTAAKPFFRYLAENGIAACGTARKNRLSLPDSFMKTQYRFRRSDNLLAVRYHAKKEIYVLFTMHTMKVINTGEKDARGDTIEKLQVIHDYNQKMGGVDKNDAVVGNYSCIRKSYKWTTKVFLHYFEEALFNSYMIHKSIGGKQRFLKYKMAVIDGMLREAGVNYVLEDTGENRIRRHFPQLIPATTKKDKPQKKCVVCTKNGKWKESRYECSYCS